jgi:hypothetical protein
MPSSSNEGDDEEIWLQAEGVEEKLIETQLEEPEEELVEIRLLGEEEELIGTQVEEVGLEVEEEDDSLTSEEELEEHSEVSMITLIPMALTSNPPYPNRRYSPTNNKLITLRRSATEMGVVSITHPGSGSSRWCYLSLRTPCYPWPGAQRAVPRCCLLVLLLQLLVVLVPTASGGAGAYCWWCWCLLLVVM